MSPQWKRHATLSTVTASASSVTAGVERGEKCRVAILV